EPVRLPDRVAAVRRGTGRVPRALDAVELPRSAGLSVDASGRAVRADPARAKVTTRGIQAMPTRGMIPESAEFQRSTGVVGPERAKPGCNAILDNACRHGSNHLQTLLAQCSLRRQPGRADLHAQRRSCVRRGGIRRAGNVTVRAEE